MKNLKPFGIFITLLALSITLNISCSNDNSSEIEKEAKNNAINYVARLSSNDLKDFKLEFITIMNSGEYARVTSARDLIIYNMNGNAFTFKSRTDFVSWISTNLALTKFTSVTNATAIYDDSIEKLEELHSRFSGFYTSQPTWDRTELSEIYAPVLGNNPPDLGTKPSWCVDLCISILDLDTAANDARWMQYMEGQTQFEILMYAMICHADTDFQINLNYINCFYDC